MSKTDTLKNGIAILLLCLMSQACQRQEKTIGYVINPSIQAEVEQRMPGKQEGGVLTLLEYRVGDQLRSLSDQQRRQKQNIFRAFYQWRGDTMKIMGTFGIFSGDGFSVKIADQKASFAYMIGATDAPAFADKTCQHPLHELPVSHEDAEIVLDRLPQKTEKEPLYGYVEIKSGSYYTGKNSEDAVAHQVSMKIYFQATWLRNR